jgi:hypothetical protein
MLGILIGAKAKRHRFIAIGLFAVLLIGLTFIITINSKTPDFVPGPPGSDPDPVKVLGSETTTVDLGGGAHLIIPPGAMTPGAIVHASYKNHPDGDWNDLKPLAAPIKLTSEPANAIHGLLTLEFPVPTGYYGNDSGQQTISTFDPTTSRWIEVATTYDTARHMLIAEIPHFSWYDPTSWNWDAIITHTNQRIGQLIGKRADAPKCDPKSPPPQWSTAFAGISTDPAIAVRACVQSQGDVLDVEMVNNRPYSMYLTYPYGVAIKWGWHESGNSAEDKARNILGDRLAGPGRLYLPPLSHASVGIPKTTKYQQYFFNIGYGMRPYTVDAVSNILGTGAEAIPGAGPCLEGLFSAKFGGVNPANLRDNALKIFHCAAMDANGRAAMVGWQPERLKAFGKTLKLAGKALQVGTITWQLSDLFVDNYVINNPSDLGAGFSFLGRFSDNSTPPVKPTAPPSNTNPAAPTSTFTPTPTPIPAPTPTPTPIPPTTWTEQSGTHGSPTFTNPYNASGQGATIQAMSTVQVTCRVYAPAIASANPDGWWYKIASSPWNNSYYAVANTFWNGDIPGHPPYTHNTDFSVPICQ